MDFREDCNIVAFLAMGRGGGHDKDSFELPGVRAGRPHIYSAFLPPSLPPSLSLFPPSHRRNIEMVHM